MALLVLGCVALLVQDVFVMHFLYEPFSPTPAVRFPKYSRKQYPVHMAEKCNSNQRRLPELKSQMKDSKDW
ncbi:hypothetical protein MAR_005015 [Mya arenaria]|uniref:Uncharacterized protein n=1 Tax=Mya arenaria TaxID=6604 RepID=A0ABY7EYE7_MYAAR|nr:hypothetical protein MAR_005015 [Mya arenaria]